MDFNILDELSQLWGPSGEEEQVSTYIAEHLMEKCDEMFKDALGNLFVLKKGYGENKKTIMCAAHMDEIGFAIQAITDDGFLVVRNIGGIGAKLIQNTRIEFRNRVHGILTTNKEIVKEELSFDSYYVDIGARNKEEALQHVEVGDKAVFVGPYQELLQNRVVAKALDDRVGCFVLMEALKEMESPYHDVYFVFTVQEEFGLIGATVAGERIQPDLGIAVDITGCYDTPDSIQGNMHLDGGAAIKVIDAGVICDVDIVQGLKACAGNHGIKYQMEVLPAGKTDVSAIKQAHFGCKGAGISLATRNGHGASSMCSKEDIESSVRLLSKSLEMKWELENLTIYK